MFQLNVVSSRLSRRDPSFWGRRSLNALLDATLLHGNNAAVITGIFFWLCVMIGFLTDSHRGMEKTATNHLLDLTLRIVKYITLTVRILTQ